MPYIRLSDGLYPVTEREIRLEYPNVSFPELFVPPETYAVVLETPKPQSNQATEGVREIAPTQDAAGNWLRTYEVYALSPEEALATQHTQWQIIRALRNTKLENCDWTQLPDAPVDATAWATYRQALRDITNQSDPFNIIWPEEPV